MPIVMAQGVDPVGAGFVKSLARPGGNITGFTQFEYALAAKWVEMLKEMAPHVKRIGIVREVSRWSSRRCAVGGYWGCGIAARRGTLPDRSAV